MAESNPIDDAFSDAGPDDAVQDAIADAQASVDEMRRTVEPGMNAPAAASAGDGRNADIDLLSDVELEVAIELGRTEMLVEDVLRLGEGSVVELDKLAGDPVDVYVNGRLVARGEVLVLNDNFCIRISEIVANLEEESEEFAQLQDQAKVA